MSDGRVERQMVLRLLAGKVMPDQLPGSTSEIIAAFLAVGRFEALPEPYREPDDAWDRLNAIQRNVVREFNPTFRAARWDSPVRYI